MGATRPVFLGGASRAQWRGLSLRAFNGRLIKTGGVSCRLAATRSRTEDHDTG
ncbi:hypothetical protein YW3DRAFT_06833 [Streptomyces sp. MnatMP-M77]|nr:hypothetical protein YW3DRAFT_06833 [Streptomyces sp. MnatMP-M77]